ncbi:Retrovirus-related Pol polyprotein from type-1 retrotransposable element R1 [Eumeta japonica]|uniref:Retrovirus-related Pol polyprotein from type-1 retrotransposable element R1 n=1 Tax=Eumeta variegata TaxID=151549 RepID=A0A4C1SEV4_EUMVA|nr:Retrovirus-related Pol polyprotein from type-1 retrotransposable element R1 [Eumeta japonica]
MNDSVKKRDMKVNNVSKTKMMVFERGNSTTECDMHMCADAYERTSVYPETDHHQRKHLKIASIHEAMRCIIGLIIFIERESRAPGPTLGVLSGLTPVSLWALLEWTFISPVLVGSKMKKYLKNTQEEDESGTSGQTAHQTSRNRSAETEKLMKVLSVSVSKEERISGKGRNALKAALESGLEFTKEQAMDILGKLIKDLRGFADPKVNVHKPIKNQLASIEGVFEILQKLETQEQGERQKTSQRSPAKRTPPPRTNDVTTDTNTEMELETDADTESTAQDNREVRKAKRKIRSPEDGTERTTKKLRDFGPSPQPKTTVQKTERKRENVWQEVLSKREKQAKERLPKQPANKSRPEPKRKQPRKFIRPDALIIRPAEKAKYVEILRRIKKDVPQDQTHKGQALLKTIQSILKEEAQVICKGPEEQLEIRYIDEETTKNDVREALQEAAGDDYKIPEEVIKIRPAYRGTQTASVRLPAATAQKILGEKGKIRIGWVNCRIRAVKTPLRCYKCWHFGHTTVQCKRYRSSVWFWSMPGLPRSTTEADEQTNMKILQLNINHCEAAHDLLMQTSAVNNGSAGFVAASVDGIRYYSCYAPPSLSIAEFTDFLDRLTEDAKQHHPVAIAGDFNAWAVDWGSKQTNARGRELLEAFSTLDIVLLNSGDRPTYTKGDASSIVDLTLSVPALLKGTYQANQHHWLEGEIFDPEVLLTALDSDPIETKCAEDHTKALMMRVTQACDASMPRKRVMNSRPAVHWWNDHISNLRKECHRKRRISQRHKESKSRCWKELIHEVDKDVWGRPYKVVMTHLKKQQMPSPTCPQLLQKIVTALFPQQRSFDYQLEPGELDDIPPVTEEELLEACNRVGNNKAPGLDGIPNIALKTIIKAAPSLFLEAYNSCLKEGTFPRKWKQQRLVLLPKGKKPPEEPSSYRPLCMLDTAGKIFERIIHQRIDAVVDPPRRQSVWISERTIDPGRNQSGC